MYFSANPPTQAVPMAFLGLWNSVLDGQDWEYENWHALEHVPERTVLPGFIEGRRYFSALGSKSQYFTLYLLKDLSALETDMYQDVQESPTDWSAKMRLVIRDFVRIPCNLLLPLPSSCGGMIVTAAFDLLFNSMPELTSAICPVKELNGVLGVTVGVTDRLTDYGVTSLGGQVTNRIELLPNAQRVVVIVDVLNSAVARQAEELLETIFVSAAMVCAPQIFAMQSQIRKCDLLRAVRPNSHTNRLPPQTDLFELFSQTANFDKGVK
jgi:hypothetical protein